MSMKNLGSKLASGVHKVKLKHEKESPATPIKTVPATKPVAPRTAQQTAERLERLHPSRIWPD